MEMLRSFRGDKHEFCLAAIKLKHDNVYIYKLRIIIIIIISTSILQLHKQDFVLNSASSTCHHYKN